MNLIEHLFSAGGFLPHGHCYLWDPWLVWLHVVSDSLITIAYFTIPVTLITIARRRKDLPFDWMFACFGVFILACGATHALEVWTLWTPTYWLSGIMKAVTAAASVATAILLVRLIPQLLAIPGLGVLREANAALLKEAAEHRRADEEVRAVNERLLLEARERIQAEEELRKAMAKLLAADAERTAMEATLHEARDVAEHANSAKEEFLSRMSHELRTPLNAILGFGQLLELDEHNPEEADNIHQIMKASRHLLTLVDEVLEVSRLATDALDSEIPGWRADRSALGWVDPSAPKPDVQIPSSGTLLYIEESLTNLRLISCILARRPAIDLLSAATVEQGLEMARERLPDLILLDLALPEKEGDRVLTQLGGDPRTSEIPVVMVTAEDVPEARAPLLIAGACAFLTKPVEVRTLLAVLDRFMGNRA